MKNNILRIFDEKIYDSGHIYNMFGFNAIISEDISTKSRIVKYIKKNFIEKWRENNNYGVA